jgi:hypothetical protein
MPPTDKKVKLTLSVDENTVNKAKSLGLNLSEITQDALKYYTFKSDVGSLYNKYQELFNSMLPLMNEYETAVRIGEITEYDQYDNPVIGFPIYLLLDGSFDQENESPEDLTYKDIQRIPISAFLEPKQILANFIAAIAEAKKKRDEKIDDLEMAQALITAITEKIQKAKTQTQVGSVPVNEETKASETK